ncbi:MAG: TetR/AcrR family transcriptional regulator [Oscillospiraceae bacterium]
MAQFSSEVVDAMAKNTKKKDDPIKKFEVFDRSYDLPYQSQGTRGKTKDRILMEATILFARQGFAAVSMKDIADAVQVQAASLYNHFDSKETLWKAVLTHAKELYLLFFVHMEEQIQQAASFEAVLAALFDEPEKMDNQFTCYAFSLIQAEQFRDAYASEIFGKYLLQYAIDFVKAQLDACVDKGMVPPFDTLTTAAQYSHTVLIGIELSVQKLMGRPTPYAPGEMVARLHQLLLDTLCPKAPIGDTE